MDEVRARRSGREEAAEQSKHTGQPAPHLLLLAPLWRQCLNIAPSKSLGGGKFVRTLQLFRLFGIQKELREIGQKSADRGIYLHYCVKICTHSHVLEKTQSFLTSALTSRSAVRRRRKGGGWRFCRHRPVHTFPRETKQEMLCGVRRILQRVSALLQKFRHRTSNKMRVFRESARRRSTHSQVNTTGRAHFQQKAMAYIQLTKLKMKA